VKLHLAGHFLQRLENIRVFHVINGDVERTLRPLDELNQLGDGFSVDLRAFRLEIESETARAKSSYVSTYHVTFNINLKRFCDC
jgi:hypothetical protein